MANAGMVKTSLISLTISATQNNRFFFHAKSQATSKRFKRYKRTISTVERKCCPFKDPGNGWIFDSAACAIEILTSIFFEQFNHDTRQKKSSTLFRLSHLSGIRSTRL